MSPRSTCLRAPQRHPCARLHLEDRRPVGAALAHPLRRRGHPRRARRIPGTTTASRCARSTKIEGRSAEWTQAEADGAFFGGPGSRRRPGQATTPQPYWSTLTSGKLGISLNTRHPEGLELAERLVGISDALSRTSAPKCCQLGPGAGTASTRSTRALVYMSTSGFGHSGDWSGYRSFGPTAAAQSRPLADVRPARQAAGGLGLSYMDVMGGWMGGLALLMGLLQAKKTGQRLLHRLRGDRGRDVAARGLHARLPGERPPHAPPGLPARQSLRLSARWRRTTPIAAPARTAPGRTGGCSSPARRRRNSSRCAR